MGNKTLREKDVHFIFAVKAFAFRAFMWYNNILNYYTHFKTNPAQ